MAMPLHSLCATTEIVRYTGPCGMTHHIHLNEVCSVAHCMLVPFEGFLWKVAWGAPAPTAFCSWAGILCLWRVPRCLVKTLQRGQFAVGFWP